MKSEDEVICLSQMTAKKGKESQLRDALQALIQTTLLEEGCIAYELWQDINNKRSFIMYERFQNQEAFDLHVNQPYIQEFVKNEYATCVESRWNMDFKSLS